MSATSSPPSESIRLLAEAHRLRQQRRRQQSGSNTSSEDDDENFEDNLDIAFYIVGFSFFVLLIVIGLAFVLQGDSDAYGNSMPRQHGRRQRRGRRAQSTVVDVSLSLSDLFSGVKKSATIHRQVVCQGDTQESCESRECQGRHVQVQARRDMWSGRVDRTYYCKYNVKTIGIIPTGAGSGDTVLVEGEGNISPGLLQGDVIFKIHELSHRKFRRDQQDRTLLHVNIDISLKEALLGWSKKIKHLDGSTVIVDSVQLRSSSSSSTTSPGEVIVVPGEGMPNGKGYRGDLHIKVEVKYPQNMQLLPDDMAEVVEALF